MSANHFGRRSITSTRNIGRVTWSVIGVGARELPLDPVDGDGEAVHVDGGRPVACVGCGRRRSCADAPSGGASQSPTVSDSDDPPHDHWTPPGPPRAGPTPIVPHCDAGGHRGGAAETRRCRARRACQRRIIQCRFMDMKEASSLYRLLGDDARLRILRLLARERLNVTELTSVLGHGAVGRVAAPRPAEGQRPRRGAARGRLHVLPRRRARGPNGLAPVWDLLGAPVRRRRRRPGGCAPTTRG